MQRLLDGYARFRARSWPEQRKAFEELAERGQSPKALVVACIDSRVDPAMIFDAAPGEMLTLRNVANLVPPYAPDPAYHGTSAALEFAVQVLEVPHIIVLGHGLCAGVRSLLEGPPDPAREFVAPWMSIASLAREQAFEAPPAERQQCGEFGVVKVSLINLMSFPWVVDRVRSGKLQLHGAWFNIGTGVLMIMKPDGAFVPV
jgi:carbonic anhydrase